VHKLRHGRRRRPAELETAGAFAQARIFLPICPVCAYRDHVFWLALISLWIRNTSKADFMPDVEPVDDKLNVFISYSRDDLDFADQLDKALRLTGFATLDRHGISGGEDWRIRLGGLIRAADTVVFVLSPASAASEICAWEVGEAARLNKRIIPVLCRTLGGESPPLALAQRNYIFFYREPKSPGSGFGGGLGQLVTALNTDLDWLREHTRLLQRATEWQVGGRSANRLLSGEDIAAAKAWAARRPKDAPSPTELHLAFLRASEDEEAARAGAERRRLDEMAAAQEERQKAIEEREAAVKRAAAAQRARALARQIPHSDAVATASATPRSG
jgi:hypothetical protein